MTRLIVRLRNERGLSNEIGERGALSVAFAVGAAAIAAWWLDGWPVYLVGVVVWAGSAYVLARTHHSQG